MIRSLLVIILNLALAACANNVPQSSNTGDDGSKDKAKELPLANGEAKDTGIVTYPGGDRFDWKVVELPEKQVGNLELVLKWKTPRPGLQLAFDVFDQYGHEAVKSRAYRKAKGYRREEIVENAKGKYFIRVYAVGRGDAGKYTLTVTFSPPVDVPIFDPLAIEIPNPPKLADVPAVVLPCTDENFDVKKPECQNYCPTNRTLAPPEWPACKGPDSKKCTTPDIENLVCWEDPNTRPGCPTPWRKKFARWCKEPTVCPDPPDPDIKACKASGFVTRVLTKNTSGSDVLVVVGGGTDRKMSDAWKCRLLRSGTTSTYVGASCSIIRIDKTKTTLKISGVTLDVVTQNDQVALDP